MTGLPVPWLFTIASFSEPTGWSTVPSPPGVAFAETKKPATGALPTSIFGTSGAVTVSCEFCCCCAAAESPGSCASVEDESGRAAAAGDEEEHRSGEDGSHVHPFGCSREDVASISCT